MAELNRQGIPTGILIAPLMPGINDSPEQVERILELAEEAGAVSVGGIALHLRGEVRGIFFDWLRSQRPTWCRATSACTPAAPTCRGPRASGSRGCVGRGRRFLRTAPVDDPPPPPSQPAQPSLF